VDGPPRELVEPEPKAAAPEPKAAAPEPKAAAPEPKAAAPEPKAAAPEPKHPITAKANTESVDSTLSSLLAALEGPEIETEPLDPEAFLGAPARPHDGDTVREEPPVPPPPPSRASIPNAPADFSLEGLDLDSSPSVLGPENDPFLSEPSAISAPPRKPEPAPGKPEPRDRVPSDEEFSPTDRVSSPPSKPRLLTRGVRPSRGS
jgi:hypothetical protein